MNGCEYPGCGRTVHLYRVTWRGVFPRVAVMCSRHAFGWRGADVAPLAAADGPLARLEAA